jgi:hypothetical protein
MKTKVTEKMIPVHDPHLVAFLLLRSFIPKLTILNGRITWSYEDPTVSEAIQDFYGGQRVTAIDFVEALKKVKSQMYGAKSMGAGR